MIRFREEGAHTPGGPAPEVVELERVGDELAELAARIHAAEYRFLERLRRFDALFEKVGGGLGFGSTAEWLSWRTGLGPGASRERVRVARALEGLPLVSEAMRRGELSYSKVRALTRIGAEDGEEEKELVEFARQATASQLERFVRKWKMLDRLESREEERRRHESRRLTLRVEEDGSWVVRGRLDPEVGLLLERAVEWASEALYRRARCPSVADPTEKATPEQKRADALGLVCDTALRVAGGEETNEKAGEESDEKAGGEEEGSGAEREKGDAKGKGRRSAPVGRAERFQVVVHVDAERFLTGAAAGGGPDGEPAAGVGERAGDVSAETRQGAGELRGRSVPARRGESDSKGRRQDALRRLSCDAGLVVMVHGAEGEVLDVGRKRRTVPAALRRALEHRDGGCRFPGCGNRYTDAHHLRHWSEGGETTLDNLALLCRRHHRAVHEGGFQVEWGEDGELRFRWPGGEVLPRSPRLPDLGDDPVEGLRVRDRAEGIEIDPETCLPEWRGERLDWDMVFDRFRGRREEGP